MPGDGAVSETPKYLIGAVTKLTGLSVDVVRVWERRYGAVHPARSDGGTRLYSDADVLRLRRLRRAVERGHSISQAARLSEGELDEMIADGKPSDDDGLRPYRAVRERFIEAVQKMDVAAAEEELARAATLFHARDLVREIVAPTLDDMNKRWASKEFSAAHERLAAELLRRMLSSLFRFYPPAENAETLLLATPAEEPREIGLLSAALLAATYGWRAVYLGADLPASEISLAVRLTNASVLVLNVQNYSARLEAELDALWQLLPAPTRVLIAGAGAAKYALSIRRAGWTLVSDLCDLDDKLKR